MIKKTLVVVCSILIAFSAVAALQPSEFSVTRSVTIAAPTSQVFTNVNNLHKWDAWSPWAKLDPNARNTFEGPAEGTGASMAWAGNHEVGEGKMTIVESRPTDLIRLKLDFIKPFASTADQVFSFRPEGSQSVVSWTMRGKSNFIGKIIGLFFNCEKVIGGQFDKGLASLKAINESR